MNAVRDLHVALVVLVVNTVLLIAVSFKYLHAVNMPQPRCLYPAFVPTQIEAARKPSDVEVWL